MTKQVHIHIHRTKARDAGEGEGKWITLSPSGTHVKIDKGGEITAGPKGMTGKKPSELAKKSGSTPAPGKTSEPSTQQVSKHVGRKVQPSKPGWALRADPVLAAKFEAAEARSKAKKLERETGAPSAGKAEGGTHEEDRKHFLSVVRDPKKATTQQLRESIDYWHEVGTKAGHGGQEHAASQQRMRMAVSELQARGEKVPGFERPKVAPTSVNQKAAAEMRKASAPDPIKQARQFEEKASKLHQQAQAEYQKNGPSDEHAPLQKVLQELREDGAGQDAARLQKAMANERQGVAITSAQSIAIAKAYERASHLAYERGDQKVFKQYQEIASRYRRT